MLHVGWTASSDYLIREKSRIQRQLEVSQGQLRQIVSLDREFTSAHCGCYHDRVRIERESFGYVRQLVLEADGESPTFAERNIITNTGHFYTV